jgi:HEPN domain-containing protein
MSAEMLIASLVRIAKQDLDEAMILHTHKGRNAIYLCQQAAEKIIRAVLTAEGSYGGVGHNLEEMIDRIPDVNPLKLQLREIEKLTTYATTYRYPNRNDQIPKNPDDIKFLNLSQKVNALLSQTVTLFGVDLANQTSTAQNPGPIR